MRMPQIDVDLSHEIPEDEIADLHDLSSVLKAERLPDDPATPSEVFRASVRHHDDMSVGYLLRCRDEAGRLTAYAGVGFQTVGENQHAAHVNINVRPDARRAGLGSHLLARGLEIAAENDRRTAFGKTTDLVPAGGEFLTALGASAGLASHVNRMVLADMPHDMIEAWMAEGPTRAPDYALEWVPRPIPDDVIDDVLAAYNIMNDAPRGDLEFEDEHLTSEMVRAHEASMAATGTTTWGLFARHVPTGEMVGFTEILFSPSLPNTAHQMGTAVRADHRGHALGKWLKAAMALRLLEERPDVVDVRTENADSNDPMKGINYAMGFAPYYAETIWQLDIEATRKALAAR